MDIPRWISGAYDPPAGAGTAWPFVTVALSSLVAAGYVVIAFNWYFQSKLARAESRSTAARLAGIVACCAAAGYGFFTADFGWWAWRAYDVLLLLLAAHTWSFALHMRGGLSLVDERLAQVDELERSATKYREIAELLPHVVWTATAEGAVDFSNRRWTDYAGEGTSWTAAVHPQEEAEVTQWWRTAVRRREATGREVRLRGGDGAYRTFAVRATPIARGDAVKWLGACADVEDQHRLAAEKELQARQKAFFLNALSHDLRAPLHNVVLNAHLLKMSARDEAEDESLKMIVENAVAAGDLVTKLLDFARAGEDRDVPERVGVTSMLHHIARRFQPAAERKGLFVEVDETGDPDARAEVWVDRQKVERIVSNLVDNAIKFTGHGGVTVGAALLPPMAAAELGSRHGSTEGVGGTVVVRVRDSGVGIPASSVPHLFDEFYQVDNHERDRNKGFGIGLAICRSLARQLGGDVRLVDTGGGGSCFELVLAPATALAAGAAPGADVDKHGGGHAYDRVLGQADGRGGERAGTLVGLGGGPGSADVRAGRGGRPHGEAGDREHPEASGLCRV